MVEELPVKPAKTERVQLRLTKAERETLEERARSQSVSLTDYLLAPVRRAMEDKDHAN